VASESVARITTGSIGARLDRLPVSSYTRRLIVLITLGGCFEIYDLFLAAYVSLGLIEGHIFKATTAGLFDINGFASFVASFFAGLFVGTIAFSWVSDRMGRRTIFAFSLLWYSIGTAIMAFQQNAASLDLWRFIVGIGIGVELVNIDAYVSELVPRHLRGKAIAFVQGVTFISVPIVAFIATLLIPRTIGGLAGWRWVLLIGAVGAIFIWFIRLGLPESPRWLARRGRTEEADRITTVMERRAEAEHGPLPPAEQSAEEAETKGSWLEMWRPPYRTRTVMLVLFNFFQTIGYYGFATWVPVLLQEEGVTTVKSLTFTFLIALVAPVGPLLAIPFADRWQRKFQIVWSAAGIAVFGLLFSQMRAPFWIVLFGMLVTTANNWMSWSFHAYQAELYPTRIRAQAVGFVYSWSRFSTIFVGFWIAAILRAQGTTGVFLFIAAAMAVVMVIVTTLGPRTSGRQLEELSP
jgi:putative MFS transporter